MPAGVRNKHAVGALVRATFIGYSLFLVVGLSICPQCSSDFLVDVGPGVDASEHIVELVVPALEGVLNYFISSGFQGIVVAFWMESSESVAVRVGGTASKFLHERSDVVIEVGY